MRRLVSFYLIHDYKIETIFESLKLLSEVRATSVIIN
jgi:hypothetical protein